MSSFSAVATQLPGVGSATQFLGTPDPFALAEIDATLLPGGRFVPPTAEEVDRLPRAELRLWMEHRTLYCLPTRELVDWLREHIGGRSAIEIGAGRGLLGAAVGIPSTDSWQQALPEVQAMFKQRGGLPITYPEHVQRLEALEAVRVHRPSVVVGAWVTHYSSNPKSRGNGWGVMEEALPHAVDEYLLIGHSAIHHFKPLLKLRHERLEPAWLRSRSTGHPGGADFIAVWQNPRRKRLAP